MNTKEKILKAAVELFSEKGFTATTTRDICAKAQCNIAAVNYHFHGKKGLGTAVIDYLFEDYDERHSAFLKAPLPTTEGDWQNAVVSFIHNFISEGKDEYKTTHRTRIVFRELSNPTTLFHDMHTRFLKPIQECVRNLIRLGLREDSNEAEVNMWLITLMSQCVFFRKKHTSEMGLTNINLNDPKNVDLVSSHIAKTLFGSLKFVNKNKQEE
jgi:AcrR family transcriptional regulator